MNKHSGNQHSRDLDPGQQLQASSTSHGRWLWRARPAVGLVLAASMAACTHGPEDGCVEDEVELDTIDQALVATDRLSDRADADFNMDGRTDLIAVTDTGSRMYFGRDTGGFTPASWVRSDLELGHVDYTVGDYNGDGRSDLIITTDSGSYEYLAKPSGDGFVANAWVRTDLKRGQVKYTAGDFNGDGRCDLMITTSDGSFEYLGRAAGGFVANAYVRAKLTIQNTTYAPGDFNGDGITDLIIQVTPGGAYAYLGKPGPNGGFIPDTWTIAATAEFWRFSAADFNGDGYEDLLMFRDREARSYISQGNGSFLAAWSGRIMTNETSFFRTGDFNGDGKSDIMLIQNDVHRYYFGSGQGFAPVAPAVSGGYHTMDWTSGDFDGDGRTEFVRTMPGWSQLEYPPSAVGGTPTLAAEHNTDWKMWHTAWN